MYHVLYLFPGREKETKQPIFFSTLLISNKMRKHALYHVDRDIETKCFQLRNIYPGAVMRQKITDNIREYISKRPHIYNGGWAIHKYLESIDPSLRIYNESDICEMTDFDLFGVNVIDDLIRLGYALKKEIPELSYTVNNGVHTNQFTIGVNFLGQKLVDWIHIPSSVFKKLPTVKYNDGSVCVHPKIELLRHYYVLSDYFSVAPDKDINKLLKRIFLLEKHVFVPWMKENKLWYVKDVKKKLALLHADDKQFTQLDEFVNMNWFEQQKFVVKITSTTLSNEREYVVHDTKFVNVSMKLLQCIRRFCKHHNIPESDVTITTHEPFIGVIGPSYNGWLEVQLSGNAFIKLYSLTTPVHVYDVERRLCSYFHSMSHWLWRILYIDINGSQPNDVSKKEQLELQVATTFKNIKYDDMYYTVLLKKNNFVGTTPIKNIYMMNNILRYKNINTLKVLIDDKKDVPKINYKYNEFEGKTIFSKKLSKIDKHSTITLPSLHPSIPKTDNADKVDSK